MAQPRGQLSLIHKKRETPGVSLFYTVCTSHSTRPYTTLAAVPNTMTGPATVNIFTAVPVIRPSGCVKIDIQFFRNFFSCLQSGPLIVLACRYKCKPARSTHIYLNLS